MVYNYLNFLNLSPRPKVVQIPDPKLGTLVAWNTNGTKRVIPLKPAWKWWIKRVLILFHLWEEWNPHSSPLKW